MALEICRAEGCFLYDCEGNRYYDLISGFSVSNLGHSNPSVLSAIHQQVDRYLHTMVYGEFIQQPQVELAKLLVSTLPPSLNQVYFVNSGAEAVETALKLAKRHTHRTGLVTFRDAYHGSTHGALSVMGNERFKTAFRPLLPDVSVLPFNDPASLQKIDHHTAAVIIEPIQAEAGIRVAGPEYFRALRKRCTETGALLIFDEIQTGFGRTGGLFALHDIMVEPDMLVLAKALGGGMPLGAVVADQKLLNRLTFDPPLGHVTTFGGHPVSCAAGLASLKQIIDDQIPEKVSQKEERFRKLLVHPAISEIRGKGLLLALELNHPEKVTNFFSLAPSHGMIFDYFLFCNTAIRVAPPLIISDGEIEDLSSRILQVLNKV